MGKTSCGEVAEGRCEESGGNLTATSLQASVTVVFSSNAIMLGTACC